MSCTYLEFTKKSNDSTQDRTGDVLRVKQMPWPTRPSNQLVVDKVVYFLTDKMFASFFFYKIVKIDNILV